MRIGPHYNLPPLPSLAFTGTSSKDGATFGGWSKDGTEMPHKTQRWQKGKLPSLVPSLAGCRSALTLAVLPAVAFAQGGGTPDTPARTAITCIPQIKSKSSVFAFPSIIRGKYLPRAIVVVFRKFLASSPSAPGQFIRQSFHLGSVRCPCCQEQRSDTG